MSFNLFRGKVLLFLKYWTDWVTPGFMSKFIWKQIKVFLHVYDKSNLIPNFSYHCGIFGIKSNSIYTGTLEGVKMLAYLARLERNTY